MQNATELLLIDPFSEWVILDNGQVVLTFNDGHDTGRVVLSSLSVLTKLSVSLTDAAATKAIFESEGFEAACEFVDKVYEHHNMQDYDDNLGITDDDIAQLLGD